MKHLSASGIVAWVIAVVVAFLTPVQLIGAAISHMGRAGAGMDAAILVGLVGSCLVLIAGLVWTRVSIVRERGHLTRIGWCTAVGTILVALVAGLVMAIAVRG